MYISRELSIIYKGALKEEGVPYISSWEEEDIGFQCVVVYG
jgi:hypothetical protein